MSAAPSPTSCIATWTPARSPSTKSRQRPTIPSRGIIQGIAEICRDNGVAAGDIDYVLHGTTTATNAVLEHKGARAGMLTNEGFRDIIHIARHQRVEHYSIMQELPWQNRPLVKRRHRKVVKGRLVPPHGEELEPLDEAGVLAAARALKAEGVEAVAVCFLFSYLNPAHEERAKRSCSANCRAFSSSPLRRSRRNFASSSGSRRPASAPSSDRRCAVISAAWKRAA